MPEIAVERETERSKRQKRLVISLAVFVGGLLWCGWKWREARLYRQAIAEIGADLEKGLHWRAGRKLTTLLAWKPDSDEGNYLLGVSEKARGRIREASEAWLRVQPDSSFAPRAIEGRVELEIGRGRLADAERIVEHESNDPRIDGSGLGLFLGQVYALQGRLDDAKRVVQVRWKHLDKTGEGGSEEAINLARLHIEIQSNEIPVDEIRSFLDHAAESAPDDDRVWLGKANLAIRIGSYDEAARWLDACQRRRPEDVPVSRARLNWAIATDRVTEAKAAMSHLPAKETDPAQIHRLAAWLAAKRGDLESERRALERLIAADPGATAAYDRLIEQATQAGKPDRAVEIRHKRDRIVRVKTRYHARHKRNQPLRDAAELARMAEQLGRLFEAQVFLSVATVVDPERADLRGDLAKLRQRLGSLEREHRTVATVLAVDPDAGATSSVDP